MAMAERDALDTKDGEGMVVLVSDGATPGLHWWTGSAWTKA